MIKLYLLGVHILHYPAHILFQQGFLNYCNDQAKCWESDLPRGVFRVGGGLWGLSPPLDQWNLLISGGFQPPLEREKNLSHHWTNSWIRPWTWPSINPGLLEITFEILSFRAKFHISVSFRYLLSRNLFYTFKRTVSGKITLRTKMALLDWQRYPWKLCLKYDLDIKVFCLFKLFISFAVSFAKMTCAFLVYKKQRRKLQKRTLFLSQKNDGIFQIFIRLWFQGYCCKSSITIFVWRVTWI